MVGCDQIFRKQFRTRIRPTVASFLGRGVSNGESQLLLNFHGLCRLVHACCSGVGRPWRSSPAGVGAEGGLGVSALPRDVVVLDDLAGDIKSVLLALAVELLTVAAGGTTHRHIALARLARGGHLAVACCREEQLATAALRATRAWLRRRDVLRAVMLAAKGRVVRLPALRLLSRVHVGLDLGLGLPLLHHLDALVSDLAVAELLRVVKVETVLVRFASALTRLRERAVLHRA